MSESQPFSKDREARQRIRQSLDESLLVEAAAGTGKTTVLVDRLVAILSRGDTRIDRVVAVTFTRKAAGELKLRLRQELGKARERAETDEVRERLEEAIARLEEAHIGTIHSFCAEILRQRPVEAGIDPGFIELDEQESASLFDRAFQSWIEEQLNAMPTGLRRALSRLARRPGSPSGSPIDALREAARSLVEWRDFDGPWERPSFDREELINHLVEQVNELAELSRRGTPRDALSKALEPVTGVEAWIRFSEEASEQRDFDAVEAQMIELLAGLKDKLNWRGNTVNFARDLPRQQVLDARGQLLDALEIFKHRADADLAITLRSELLGVLELYERLKTHSGRLDFLDLLLYCRNLLRDRPDVRQFFQERFSHLFVDEFQDTDPLQTEILLLLVADDPAVDHWRQSAPAAGKLFLVADPKQSIYRFRRADVVLYQEVKDHLAASGVGVVLLSRSFRATAPLQQAINHAFERRMSEDREGGQPGYVALEGDRPGAADQPSLIALPAPAPFGYRGRPTKTAVAKCLPDVTAAFVEFMLRHSGWQVADPATGDMVAIAPRHICLLFRRFQSWGKDITDPYLRALEARDIPHLLVGGRSLHQREEVETLRAALTAIEWPDDTLAVYATLRGSLFALPDDLLLRFHQQVGHLEPFRAIQDLGGDLENELEEDLRPVVKVLDLIETLHRQRNEIPIAETLNRLLEYCRAHAAFALRHSGHQVLANVQRIIDMARGFEVRGGLSFRGFVERLDREAENPRTRYTPVLEEGAEGVRIMNTHTAKGLEFPIVILADLGANLTPMEPSLAIDPESRLAALKILGCAPWDLRQRIDVERQRDRAEGVRVAYVAATRARDLLVVTAVGSGPFGNGWLSPLDDAVYPASQSFRAATEAPGCPPFGPTTILKPPLDGPPPPTIQPGLHRPKVGDHEVVWWDPRTLRLGVPGRFGVRKDKLLHPDPDGEANQDGLDRYLDWQDRRGEALATGKQPSCDVLTVTDTEQWPPGERPTIELDWLEAAASTATAARPSGIRFGTLVHTILRDVDLDASVSAIGELSRLHGRVLDAKPGEVGAATEAVARTLKHPLLQRAASAERLCRETPFHLRLEGGFQIEGTVDLAFRDEGEWVVVDYKTDQDLEAVVDTYQRQISWYVYALEQLTGEPVRGVLLGI